MTARPPSTSYSLRRIEELLGLRRSAITALIGAGFVTPARGARNEYRFSFQDVVLLRTAHHLTQSDIPPRKVLRALRALRSKLPDEIPLSGLRLKAVGNDVAIMEGDASWEASTGQMLMNFEPGMRQTPVSSLKQSAPEEAPAADSGDSWFNRARDFESDGKLDAAQRAYHKALASDPSHAYAYLNLGALMCENGRYDEALALFDMAIIKCPDSAALHFNRALALEDGKRLREALASYQQCLALDPTIADAHFNCARLHEALGEAQKAIRHYSTYRRLTQQSAN